LLTTHITQGRLAPTLGYQRYNAYSVELQIHFNMRRMIIPFTLFHSIKNGKSHDDLHQTISLFIINITTTLN
ncbi:hypothetical protein, partial [Segatella salivae]|uniref:hypothetical protein n=1 Tax=Segatella salivae TaxID=228604 RepID=UPI00241CA8B7